MKEFLCCDCIEGMKKYSDKFFDLAIVDPPYGENAVDGSRTKKYRINRGDNWDCYRPDRNYFLELFRISKNQVIWGGNYFISDLSNTKCFIIWDKGIPEGMYNYAMCEMAWTSFLKKPAKIYKKTAMQENRIHPTQKPIALYKWLLRNYATPDMKIIDTHVGSGSSIIAFEDFGCEYIGFEIDVDYHEAAIKRISQHKAQTKLF